MRFERSRSLFVLFALIFSLLLVACGGEEPTPVPATSPPVQTSTPSPTDTPVPTNTPEPTATPDIAAGFIEFASAEGGYSIGYPEGWFTSDLFGMASIASNEALLDSPDPGEEGGASLIIADDLSEFDVNPVDDINVLMEEFDLAQDQVIVEGPDRVSINGQDATTIVIKGKSDLEIEIVAYIAAVASGDRLVIFIGVTPIETESEFLPTFKAMAQTIEVGVPEAAEISGSVGDLPEPEGVLFFGDTVTSEVTEAGPSVWTFLGIQGEEIDLLVTPLDSDLDIVLDILDSSGTSILGGEVDDAFGEEMIAALPIEDTGDYFIVVRGFADSVGQYELTFNEAGTGTDSGGFSSGGMIAYGETVNSSVPADGPSVWSFAGTADDSVHIVVDPAGDLDVVVDVLDESGNSILADGELDAAFDVEEIVGLQLPADGMYDISVRGFADGVGDFKLTLTTAGDLSGVEGMIQFGETVIGSVASSDGSAWGFYGEAGDYVDITAVPTTEEFDLVVDIIDESGVSILPDSRPLDDSYDNEFIRVLRLPATGGYAVLITGYDGDLGDYQLSLARSNGGQPGSIIFAYDEIEEAEDAHHFPFSSIAGEVLTIQVDPAADLDVVVAVYDGDSDELLDEVDATTGFEELVFVVPADGNYDFVVTGFEGSLGAYDVTLLGPSSVLFELAYGDLIIGRLAEGPDGYIEYMFGAEAGDVIDFTIETEDDIDIIFSIVDADDNILAEVDEAFSGETETFSYTVPGEGIVFFRVADFYESAGEFTLTIE